MINICKAKLLPPMERETANYIVCKADPNTHGGCYVDTDTGMLHINLVEGRENALRVVAGANMAFHVVRFSYADLIRMREAVVRNDYAMIINAATINVWKNQVRILIARKHTSGFFIPQNLVYGEESYYIDIEDYEVSALAGTNQDAYELCVSNVSTLNKNVVLQHILPNCLSVRACGGVPIPGDAVYGYGAETGGKWGHCVSNDAVIVINDGAHRARISSQIETDFISNGTDNGGGLFLCDGIHNPLVGSVCASNMAHSWASPLGELASVHQKTPNG